MSVSVVKEHNLGVYLWQMPNGALVTDEAGNYLSINSIEGEGKRIEEITRVARELGLGDGHPIFFRGPRKVSDEEYERQKARAEEGNIPDELDIGAYVDAERERKLREQDARNT